MPEAQGATSLLRELLRSLLSGQVLVGTGSVCRLGQVTGIGSRRTFWRPVGGSWAGRFALVFMRDLGSSPVAASIKKPRMRSYQTACSVLLGARDIIHVLA